MIVYWLCITSGIMILANIYIAYRVGFSRGKRSGSIFNTANIQNELTCMVCGGEGPHEVGQCIDECRGCGSEVLMSQHYQHEDWSGKITSPLCGDCFDEMVEAG